MNNDREWNTMPARKGIFVMTLLMAMVSPVLAQDTGTGDNAGSSESQSGKPTEGPVSLSVDGISVQADDDAPRVLNILPWQQPTISRRTPIPLSLDAPELLEPVDPEVLRRHQSFRQTLDPLAE